MSERLSLVDFVADTMPETIHNKQENHSDIDFIIANASACTWFLNNFDDIKRRLQSNREYKNLILPYVVCTPWQVAADDDLYFITMTARTAAKAGVYQHVIVRTGSTTREAYEKIKQDIEPAMLRWLPNRAKHINLFQTAAPGFVWAVAVWYFIPNLKENIKRV